MTRRILLVLCLAIAGATAFAASPSDPSGGWRAKVDQMIPLLGHRNWILVVDSAYPLQVSPGLETIDTNSGETEVLQYVLRAIERSIQVRPEIYLDAELPYVSDQDAPGASAYRTDLAALLRGYPVQSELHENLIANVDEAGKTFHVLILKTNLTVPYSSVFIRLNCKYWSDEAETRLRQKMAAEQR